MEITLVAISDEDGWAYFKIKDTFYIIYPPFDSILSKEVKEVEVKKALEIGFKPDNSSFRSLSELTKYIEERYVKKIDSKVFEIPNESILDELLSTASKSDIVHYLVLIEKDLIPAQEIEISIKLRNKISQLAILKNDANLFKRNLEILEKLLNESLPKFKNLTKITKGEKFLEHLSNYNGDLSLMPCK